MPIVHIHLLAGRSVEKKRKLVASVADAVCDSIGADRDTVEIMLHEAALENASKGGILFVDSRK